MNAIDVPVGVALGAISILNDGVLGLKLLTKTCGPSLTNVKNDFSTTADGVFHSGDTNNTNFNDAELTIAPKDVVLNVSHGVCGVNGATTTIIKRVNTLGEVKAIPDVKRGVNI